MGGTIFEPDDDPRPDQEGAMDGATRGRVFASYCKPSSSEGVEHLGLRLNFSDIAQAIHRDHGPGELVTVPYEFLEWYAQQRYNAPDFQVAPPDDSERRLWELYLVLLPSVGREDGRTCACYALEEAEFSLRAWEARR